MLRPTDRRVSSGNPAGRLGPQLLDEGAQMAGRDVVPLTLRREMGQDGSLEAAHPVVGIRPPPAVRHVLMGFPLRLRRALLGRHSGHRTPRRRVAALLAALAVVLANLAFSPLGA